MQYLSDEWLEAAAAAMESVKLDPAPAERLAVEYEVTGSPFGKVNYALVAGSDGLAITAGKAVDPTATMSLDYATAASITKGELSPQAAFMQGKLKLGGDVRVLIDRAGELDSAGDVLAGLRGDTEF